MDTMQIRSIQVVPGCWILIGRATIGTVTNIAQLGTHDTLNAANWTANLLVSNSNGGITYDAANHDPF